MKGQLQVSTPEEYLEQVDESRKADIAALHAMIRKIAPKLDPFIFKGMIGYGPWHYKYASGREGDWFRIGIASNQSYISLYFSAGEGERYLVEGYQRALPKAKIGKSCVRFRRLSDLDIGILKDLIRRSVKAPAKV